METKVLVFSVDNQQFGTNIRDVREVIAVPHVTALPHALDPVVGIFNLRGNIVTAVDGGKALGIPASGGERHRAVVAEVDGRLLGILVDRATEVITLNEEEVRPAPGVGALERPDLAEGIVLKGDRAITLLRLGELLGGAGAREARSEEETER
ncbi:MAG TPA: chemotaxis protein CheW [Candidatus Thermoplasmatota archaeon]|nr:chemotaxis protein CheW [Candidatus Thermoplasmatota archaeon]